MPISCVGTQTHTCVLLRKQGGGFEKCIFINSCLTNGVALFVFLLHLNYWNYIIVIWFAFGLNFPTYQNHDGQRRTQKRLQCWCFCDPAQRWKKWASVPSLSFFRSGQGLVLGCTDCPADTQDPEPCRKKCKKLLKGVAPLFDRWCKSPGGKQTGVYCILQRIAGSKKIIYG